jgi:hypothetical protein
VRLTARCLIAISLTLAACAALPACRHEALVRLPDPGTTTAEVLATSMIPPDAIMPALRGMKFGGISGIAYDKQHDELVGLSDDTENSRVFRMKYLEEPFRVVPVGVVLLEHAAGAPRKLDPEGLALLPSGNMLVSSEGIGEEEPHVPPGIIEYRRDGRFVRQLPVPQEFIPPERGSITHGSPSNQAFESLTLTPDGTGLWTGEETSLVQDGPVATADHGSLSRLLEYRLQNGAFMPAREFAYRVDPLPRVSFQSSGFSVSGLVELLALNDHELLSMERAFVEDRNSANNSVYRLRIYRVTIDGTPIQPGQDSIAGRADITPVTKTLLLDLGSSNNLPRALAGLDNFEGIAVIPTPSPKRVSPSIPAPKPHATAIIVSDDNFDARQRTWFVKLGFDLSLVP